MATLAELQPGHCARIAQIDGNDTVALRLMEMGMIAGESVELIGRAPLGDPLAVFLRGARLALRATEARRVQVESIQVVTKLRGGQ